MSNTTLTLGEYRVRTTFNPSNDGMVDMIKQKCAELINALAEDHRTDPEKKRQTEEQMQSAHAARQLLSDVRGIVSSIDSGNFADAEECDRLRGNAIVVLDNVVALQNEDQLSAVEAAAMWAVKAATCERAPAES